MKNKFKRLHIIAMGGSVMHALAIALKQQGINVTGSDDNFFDPSRSRLAAHGLLPASNGWHPAVIDQSIDIVILGMHAHMDNPELAKAQELGLKVVSFPEFIFEQAADKQRIVIGGSHGKTTITSMIMHVLKYHGREFDYVVGARVNGFDETVKLSDAPVIVIEGDEYLSSRIDPTPKFHHYHHHIGLISGIAWDHVNVFTTEEDYIRQFEIFADSTPKEGTLVYNDQDELCHAIGSKKLDIAAKLPYKIHPYEIADGETFLINGQERIKVKVFGDHNLLNLSGAKEVLARLNIVQEEFYEAIPTFKLPALRLNELSKDVDYTIFRDYAHAPSKVAATVKAVRELNPDRKLVGVFELHTYSSLNKNFFGRYANTLNPCDEAIVFYNPKAVAQKKLEEFSPNDIKTAFNHPNMKVLHQAAELKNILENTNLHNINILLMSSSNFDELEISNIF